MARVTASDPPGRTARCDPRMRWLEPRGTPRHGSPKRSPFTVPTCQWRDRPRPSEVMRMHRSIKTRVGMALSVAGLALSLSAGAVFAGEVTGNGKSLEPLRANSICAYSGLNDKVVNEGDTTSRVQSFGHEVQFLAKLGIHIGGIPGIECRGGSN